MKCLSKVLPSKLLGIDSLSLCYTVHTKEILSFGVSVMEPESAA